MEKQCYKCLVKLMQNWSTADVRTVPGIMYQIRCGKDEHDLNVEYQINWFIDCTETYVHNHRHSFDTYCLEGEYLEKSWTVTDDHTGAVTYKFFRETGNICGLIGEISGSLCHVKSRRHFPGNIMHVGTDLFHSILPVEGSDKPPCTFVAKRAHLPMPDMYILSSSPTIDAPNEQHRSATYEEREKVFNKVQDIFATKFAQSDVLL